MSVEGEYPFRGHKKGEERNLSGGSADEGILRELFVNF